MRAGLPRDLIESLASNRYWREEDASLALVAWMDSGLSLSAFGRQCGINVGRLKRWQRRLGDRLVPTFHPIHVRTEIHGPSESLELVLRGGRRVVVRPGFDEATLERLVQLVEGLPC